MSAWFILENLLNGIVDVNDVNIFLLEYLNRWRFKLVICLVYNQYILLVQFNGFIFGCYLGENLS